MNYIRWLRALLENRQVNVRFCNAMSKTCKMRQGLPQGSVLSPLLFVFYINELAELLPPDVLSSLFADDVTILGTHRKCEEAAKLAQAAVTIVVEWSKKAKLKLNASKSECCSFSTQTIEIYVPDIKIDGTTIPFKAVHDSLDSKWTEC